MLRLLTLGLALTLSVPASAHEITSGDIRIFHPQIQVAFASARTAAGYMSISNEGSEADRLIGVRIEGHDATIHQSREENGVATMVHLASVEIPADDTVIFEQGGLHIMVMGLTPGEFSGVEDVTGVLIFDRQGEVPVTFMIGAGAGHDHATH